MNSRLLLDQRVRIKGGHMLRLFDLNFTLDIVYWEIPDLLEEGVVFEQVVFEEAIEEQEQVA